ncbi:MAG TPA: HAMP domain-containing sensor histidine kinase, partial [Candidatus Acidoferrum sp.]|nr:HAMP domain-containing sensor histidine kinase [Candidatus Acidoferrum sp.]
MPSSEQLLIELHRAFIYMQLPIVGFLATASFQVKGAEGKNVFTWAGYGWLFDFGYIGLSSALQFLKTGPANTLPAIPFQVEAVAGLLDSCTAACFMMAYIVRNNPRLGRRASVRSAIFAMTALTIGSWLSNLLALQLVAEHPWRFILLSAPLVMFSLVARFALGDALFEQTKRDVDIGNGPTQLRWACRAYALIQPVYWLLPFQPQSQTVGFFAGFLAKIGIALGFVRLFSALSSKYASEQGALTTARTILGRIRHELNTPLGELKNWIDAAMPEAPAHGKLRQHLQNMESATERALAITEVRDQVLYDVIENSASAEETASAAKEVVNINTLVQTAIIAVKTTRSEDVRWAVSFAAGNCIHCSKEQVIQVVVNLLRNACDALPNSNGRITVTTTQIKPKNDEPSLESEYFVKVSIKDNGEGFAPSIREAAFKGGFTTRDGRDRGNGLAIVKRLLAMNEGAIEVTSPLRPTDIERPGTEVSLLFPKVRCDDGGDGSD